MPGQRTREDLVFQPWDDPARREAVDLRLQPDGFGFPFGQPKPMVNITGHWSCCDVWVQLPAAWLPVTMRILARIQQVWTLIDQKLVSDVEFRYQPTGAAGTLSGILFSVRGHPCDEFLVQAFPPLAAPDPPGPLEHGVMQIRAWGEDCCEGGGRELRQALDIARHPHQGWHYPIAAAPSASLVAGANVVAAPNPTGGRAYVDRVILSTTDVVPQVVRLQSALGGITDHAVYVVVAGAPIDDEFVGDAMRNLPGENWRLFLDGLSGGAVLYGNVSGFYE